VKQKEERKTLEIDVQQCDIDLGEQGAPASCAIAQAMKRIPGISRPSVSGRQIEFWLNGVWFRCAVHHVITHWVSGFDRDRKSVHPMTFTLDLSKEG
jgi:hypothetical protein